MHSQVRNVLEVAGRVQVQIRGVRHAGLRRVVGPRSPEEYQSVKTGVSRKVTSSSRTLHELGTAWRFGWDPEECKQVRGSNLDDQPSIQGLLCVGIASPRWWRKRDIPRVLESCAREWGGAKTDRERGTTYRKTRWPALDTTRVTPEPQGRLRSRESSSGG